MVTEKDCPQEIPNVLTHLKEGKLKKIEKCFVGLGWVGGDYGHRAEVQ